MAIKPIPTGYHSITPSVVVDNAAKALEFYRDALGAKETYRLPMGDKIGHAEIQIGDSRLMLSDEMPSWDALGPKSRGGATGSFMVYVPDADAAVERAVKAGAKLVQPVENQFWMLTHYAVSVLITVVIGVAFGMALARLMPRQFAFLNGGRLAAT